MEMTEEFYQACVFLRREIQKRSEISDAEAEWLYQFAKLPTVQRRLDAAIRSEKKSGRDDG